MWYHLTGKLSSSDSRKKDPTRTISTPMKDVAIIRSSGPFCYTLYEDLRSQNATERKTFLKFLRFSQTGQTDVHAANTAGRRSRPPAGPPSARGHREATALQKGRFCKKVVTKMKSTEVQHFLAGRRNQLFHIRCSQGPSMQKFGLHSWGSRRHGCSEFSSQVTHDQFNSWLNSDAKHKAI